VVLGPFRLVYFFDFFLGGVYSLFFYCGHVGFGSFGVAVFFYEVGHLFVSRFPGFVPQPRLSCPNDYYLQISRYGTIVRVMRIIALSTLKAFWTKNSNYLDAKEPILAWYQIALKADWSKPADVKQDFGNASILKDGRVVFNIAGNKFRLVVWINYDYRVTYIPKFLGNA